jgi:hypothetical protein
VGIELSGHFQHGADDSLALLCSMAAAVLFQPVLMGTLRQIATRKDSDRLH